MAIRDYRPQTRAPGPTNVRDLSLERAGDSSGLQALGGAVMNTAEVLENARQETELNAARLTMTEGLGALNEELTRDTDPATMRKRYGERLTELQNNVNGQVSTDRQRRAIGLEMARARVTTEARVFDREFALQGQQAIANVSRMSRGLVNEIIQSPDAPEAQIVALERFEASLDSLVEAGHLTADRAEEMRQGFEREAGEGLARSIMIDDPATAARMLSDPDTAFGLDETDRLRLLAQATRERDAATEQGNRILERRVETARRVLETGGTVAADDLDALRSQVEGTAHAPALEGSILASQALGKFATATPAERAAYRAAQEAAGIDLDDASINSAWLGALESLDRDLTAAETEAERVLGREVESAIEAMADGRVVTNIDDLRSRVAGTQFERHVALAEDRKQALVDFENAPPAERQNFMDQLRELGVMPDTRTQDEAFLSSLEAIDKAAIAAVEKDAVDYALTSGIKGAAPLDLGDPASIESRLALALYMSEHYDAPLRFFSDDEAEHYKKVLAEGTPQEQLGTLTTIMEAGGPGAPAILDEIDGLDPVFKRAGQLVLETGRDDVAQKILAGRKAIDTGEELRLVGDEAIEALQPTLDRAVSAQPARREEFIAAARAYYAQEAPGRVDLNRPETQLELWNEAIQRVSGQVKVSGRILGGVQEVNGAPVKLPVTLDQATTEEILHRATDALWRAGSVTGNMASVGNVEGMSAGAPVLEWVGGNAWRVGVRSNRGGVEWYRDDGTSTGFFYVDLNALHAEFLRNPPPRRDTATMAPAP